MNYRILVLTIIALFSLLSCGEDKTTNPKPNLPVINRIVPDSAYIGDIVSIIGTGFDSAQDSNFVYFNGTKATICKIWNDTLIKVIVPQGATSGKVWVTVKGIKSTEVDFTVIAYEEVKIGNQIWMLKNLDVDHYRNGDSIPEIRDSAQWVNSTTGAWCYYDNNPENGKIYGKLYNWYAVNDPRGLAPSGWHIPSDAEWKTLEMFLGMTQAYADALGYRGTNEGGKMKEKGTAHWLNPNTGATNESGFSALPGGDCFFGGTFYYIGCYGYWWSSSEIHAADAWYRYLGCNDASIGRSNDDKGNGFSVRCVRDN